VRQLPIGISCSITGTNLVAFGRSLIALLVAFGRIFRGLAEFDALAAQRMRLANAARTAPAAKQNSRCETATCTHARAPVATLEGTSIGPTDTGRMDAFGSFWTLPNKQISPARQKLSPP
jgi:hypothetical protein